MTQKSVVLTDIELKDRGNILFSSRKFDDAIACYSKAIVSSRKKNSPGCLINNIQ